MTHLLIQYSYLQILDLLTTVAFMVYGVQEANPIVRWLMDLTASPLQGLLIVKLVALVLGVAVWRSGRRSLLVKVNILFAFVVTWNLVALIVGAIGVA